MNIKSVTKEFLVGEYLGKRKSLIGLAKELGTSSGTLRKKLRQLNIPTRTFQDCFPLPALVDTTVGDWLVVRFAGLNKHGQRQFLCRCKCGVEKLLDQHRLLYKKPIACRKCIDRLGERHPLRRGFKKMSGHFWSKCRQSAKKRKHEFSIAPEYAYRLIEEQGWRCKLSGLPLYFSQHHSEVSTASLDRIDSSKGYVEGNVQWVHRDINLMKHVFNQDHFISLCRMVTETRGDRKV